MSQAGSLKLLQDHPGLLARAQTSNMSPLEQQLRQLTLLLSVKS